MSVTGSDPGTDVSAPNRPPSPGRTPTPPPYDFSGDAMAKANRQAKATKIVEWCLANGWEPDLVDDKTRRWIIRQAIPPKLSPDGKRRIYASASDETWEAVVTGYRRERDQAWLQRALADHDSPAGRILAAAAAKRAEHPAADGPAPPAT